MHAVGRESYFSRMEDGLWEISTRPTRTLDERRQAAVATTVRVQTLALWPNEKVGSCWNKVLPSRLTSIWLSWVKASFFIPAGVSCPGCGGELLCGEATRLLCTQP